MPGRSSEKSISIGELISQVKADLIATQDESNPLFAISHVELEIAYTVERKIGGGLAFSVVQAGADWDKSWVHRIRLALEPLATPKAIRSTLSSEEMKHATKLTRRTSQPTKE